MKIVRGIMRPLPVLVLVFLCSRLFLLYASMPALSEGEETPVGTITVEFLRGPLLFPVTIKSSFFGIGETWQALFFAVPLYALFGPHFVLLKVAPLVISTLALVVIWLALKRCAGTRAAVIGALLWILPPSVTLKHQLLAWARHGDSILFVFLGLLMLQRLFPGGEEPRRAPGALGALLFGAFCGWAFSYYAQFVVFSVTAWIVILALAPRRLPLYAGGFLLGNIPFLYILSRSTRLGAVIISRFMEKSALARLVDLLSRVIPALLSVRRDGVFWGPGWGVGCLYAGLFYLFLVAAVVTFLAKKIPRGGMEHALLPAVRACLRRVLSPLRLQRRRVCRKGGHLQLQVPRAPLSRLLWVTATSLAALWSSRRAAGRAAGTVLLIAVLSSGALSFVSVIDAGGWATLGGEAPYDFYFSGDMLGGYFHEDLAKAYDLVDRKVKDPVEKEQYYSGISSITSGALNRAIWEDPGKFRAMTRNLTPEQARFLYTFQGKRMAEWMRAPVIRKAFPYPEEFYWAATDPAYLPIAREVFRGETARLIAEEKRRGSPSTAPLP